MRLRACEAKVKTVHASCCIGRNLFFEQSWSILPDVCSDESDPKAKIFSSTSPAFLYGVPGNPGSRVQREHGNNSPLVQELRREKVVKVLRAKNIEKSFFTLVETVRLSPRELEGLLIHQTGFLAQKRLARGLKLNHPEAIALIACQVRRANNYHVTETIYKNIKWEPRMQKKSGHSLLSRCS